MFRSLVMTAAFGAMLLVGGVVSAAEAPPVAVPEERTVKGEIVDPASYLKDGRHGA